MQIEIFSHIYGLHPAQLDDEDYHKIKDYKWFLWSTKRHRGIYVKAYHKGRTVSMHRLIMGAQKGELVDHINGNPLDNRKYNLRIATHLINNQNAAKRKDGVTSRFKGVSWCSTSNKWKAQIQVNRVKKSLGSYKTESEAANAYNKALDLYSLVGPRNSLN